MWNPQEEHWIYDSKEKEALIGPGYTFHREKYQNSSDGFHCIYKV
jgi:hypothetical protein